MKVSVSSWAYRHPIDRGEMDLLSFLDEVKRVGADGFEIFPQHLDQSDLGGSLQRIVDRSEQLGLCVATVITSNDFALPTAALRAAEVDMVRAWIRRAASAGVRRLNVFTGTHNDGELPEVEYYRIVDSYREVCRDAAENNVLLCLENMRDICRDADGVLRIIDDVGSDYLRTNPDLINFGWGAIRAGGSLEEQAYEQLARVMPLASNVHMHVGEFTDSGDMAHLDLARVLRIMADSAYDDHIVLETGHDIEPSAACEKGVALLRKQIAAIV
jgi:sugar phosphate isomerase/epimerase